MTKDSTDEAAALAERLFDGARSGDTALLRAYIDAGAPVELTTAKGDTLLILASYHVHPETVSALIELGADLDRVNDRGQTALSAAVFRNSTPVVTSLLEAGADPELGHQTAADIAAFFQLPEMTELLRTWSQR